jgi:hypothetical protein
MRRSSDTFIQYVMRPMHGSYRVTLPQGRYAGSIPAASIGPVLRSTTRDAGFAISATLHGPSCRRRDGLAAIVVHRQTPFPAARPTGW